MISKAEQFGKLRDLITRFDALLSQEKVNEAARTHAQDALDELAAKYQHDVSVGSQRYMLYELQALLEISRGHIDKAHHFISESQELMGSEDAFVSATISKLASKKDEQSKSSSGFNGKIGGWLILFAIGLIISPFSLIYDLAISLPDVDASTDIGSYMFVAVLLDVALLVGTLFISYHFFWKRAAALTSIPAFLGVQIVAYLVFLVWAGSLQSTYGVEDTSGLRTLFWGIVSSAVWLAYWLVSKRVKATFLN